MKNNNLSQRTLVYLIKKNKLLLGYKKTGFGKGNFVGIGGKVEINESIEQAAKRELKEEIGIDSPLLSPCANMKFIFPHNPDWSQEVYTFLCTEWVGDPVETSEIAPKWFSVDSLPLSSMWDDVKYWLPAVIYGQSLQGRFILDSKLKVVEFKLSGNSAVDP